MNKISIIGSGWLGLATALAFVQKGFHVKASTTTPEKQDILKQKGIAPYLLQLDEDQKNIDPSFFLCDVLIITLPISANIDLKIQQERLAYLINKTKAQHLIYISSTSVYGENQGNVDEDTMPIPNSPSGIIQLKLEQYLLSQHGFNIAIIRSAGQYGPDRHPGKFLANKKDVLNPYSYVNMIHQADLVEIIIQLVIQNKIQSSTVYNAVANAHPTRKDFYTSRALDLNLEPPRFLETNNIQSPKIISGKKICKTLNITFSHDDLSL